MEAMRVPRFRYGIRCPDLNSHVAPVRCASQGFPLRIIDSAKGREHSSAITSRTIQGGQPVMKRKDRKFPNVGLVFVVMLACAGTAVPQPQSAQQPFRVVEAT